MDVAFWLAVAVVTVVSSARLTRLATFDAFPPIQWLRDKYDEKTDGNSWQLLAHCPYCAAPWFTLAVLLSGYFSDFHVVWWLFNGWLAASYLASMVMVHDGDESGDED